MSPPSLIHIRFPISCYQSLDLKDAYYYIRMQQPADQPLSDDSSTDEETRQENSRQIPLLRTTVEEREYSSIPGSEIASVIALSFRTAQANPTVPRGHSPQRTPRRTPPSPAVHSSKTCTLL